VNQLTETVPTGVPGLDELMSGGFPRGRVILILGGPGTGKTVLTSQFLYKGLSEFNENGIMVSLDENKNHFFSEMKNFGWDFQKAEEEGKFAFIDATRLSRVAMLKEKMMKVESSSLRGKSLEIDKLIEELQAKIKQMQAKRVIIDSLAALFYRFTDLTERRTAGVDLIEALSDLGVTVLITTELSQIGLERKISDEEFLVHGVVMMQTYFLGGTTSRGIQVSKMRGVSVNPSLVPYTIDQTGIEVYPSMSIFSEK
jgi:KaiC/GvpD/RAD55 family RecA-like ATPase